VTGERITAVAAPVLVASRLGVSQGRAAELMASAGLTPFRVGMRHFHWRIDIEDWLDQMTAAAEADPPRSAADGGAT